MAYNHYLEEEDDKGYYKMNTLSYYYEELARKTQLIESIAKTINATDTRLNLTMNDVERLVDGYVTRFDLKLESLPTDVENMIVASIENGSLDNLVSTALIDQKLAPVTTQLEETAKESDLIIERERISNLIANAGNTDGNGELLDIRVGFDGITYDTAGDATRALRNYMTESNGSWVV